MLKITFKSLKEQVQELNIGVDIQTSDGRSGSLVKLVQTNKETGAFRELTSLMTYAEMQAFICGFWFCLKQPKSQTPFIDAIDVQSETIS